MATSKNVLKSLVVGLAMKMLSDELWSINGCRSDAKRTMQDVQTIKYMGKSAAAFTRRLVEGKKVRLEFDVERRDKYNRLLAYIYLPDGTFVNAEIVANGYASLMTIAPNVKHAELLRARYKEAREKRRGLWKD